MKIPEREERDFLHNLQSSFDEELLSLNKLDDNSSLDDLNILLKACLLAVNTFRLRTSRNLSQVTELVSLICSKASEESFKLNDQI